MMKSLVLLAAAVATACMSLSAARADSVSLDTTAGSGWQVSRTPTAGAPDQTAYNGAVQNVASIPWAFTTLGGNSQWVSWNSSTGNGYTGDINGTSYVYSDTFTLNPSYTGPATFSLSGTFAFDNWVSSVTLTSDGNIVPITLTSVLPTDPLEPTEFGYQYTISADVSGFNFNSPSTFVLTVAGVNSYNPDDQDHANTNPGPTGFIFSGTASADPVQVGAATAAPLPGAAGMGMAMLAVMGAVAGVRKRLATA
jgi:hypothetical protein